MRTTGSPGTGLQIEPPACRNTFDQEEAVHKSVLALSLLAASVAQAAEPTGKHLAYTVGCVNCHHQTPKVIINAPPLTVVKSYSLPEFRHLMKAGITRGGRNMVAESSVMGIVAQEQFAHFTDAEVKAVYDYLTTQWTAEQGVLEETKIPVLYKALIDKGVLKE
jgi:mono/diheme cytochrome c family protein